MSLFSSFFFFFFNDPAPPEISPLPLHAALPIGPHASLNAELNRRIGLRRISEATVRQLERRLALAHSWLDRKSTRLNSSHLVISYAVFCLKKKKIESIITCFPLIATCSYHQLVS